jgi:2-polyprenyl-3-methyl-5-hydroxy-6-metoxy-1,4-benzoquinol methylase
MSTRNDELFTLQQTLYESRNPTRRWLHRTRRAWVIHAIERWSAGARSALEIGPGSGVYLPTLAGVAEHVVASDIERAYLERLAPLAAQYDNVHLVRDDATKSAFADGTFDLVLCSEVIEHIEDSSAALREMCRIISADGTLFLSTPQRYSLLELASKIAFLPGFIQLARRVYREPVMETGHINLMTRRQLDAQLSDAGFDVVEEWLAGLYVPVVAETLGERAVRLQATWERRVRGTRLQGILWTQFVVAQPRSTTSRTRTCVSRP